MSTPAKQRLIVCLDGTWNNRDDSTNVLHQSVLALDQTADQAGVFQRVYYDEGVGNGVLDGVTGGGFGIGLEENVREAYGWLVEYFNDTREPKYAADEIYVFGFSRGAYTARSLVGFIGRCGLLRRGAPLTVNELWSAYCLLGRQHEERSSFWDALSVEPQSAFRQITDLTPDPWSRGKAKDAGPLNPKEALLVQWSRRVRITYLGLYDTVGAMGLDALAIPGLRSRIALHHNMRPTTLIQHCRHALAIDEHRSSFQHTPLVAYYGHAHSERELERGGDDDLTTPPMTTKWKQNEQMWRRKIEQRWFVGAHSNVGGGYESNPLAQLPFAWVFEGARMAGLESKSFTNVLPAAASLPAGNDSYAAFAAPVGIHLLRLKRNYRVIAPPDDVRAARPNAAAGAHIHSGFTLKSINETVDPSVLEYYASATGRKLPPNLGRLIGTPVAGVESIARMPVAPHAWTQVQGWGIVWTPLWGALAAAGLQATTHFFSGGHVTVSPWLLMVAAFGFVMVDWCESRLNFLLAREGLDTASSAAARATKDSIYWTRAIGVVLGVIGLVTAAVHLGATGWHAADFASAGDAEQKLAVPWARPLGAAVVGTLIGGALTLFPPRTWLALLAAPLGGLAILLGIMLAWLCRRIFGVEASGVAAGIPSPSALLGGQVLLLQLGLAYVFRAFYFWVGEPLSRANLPSIFELQRCAKPAQVAAVLERWRLMLVCQWQGEDPRTGQAAVRLRTVTAEAIWRDIVGFIPVYSVVFGFGSWLASRWLPEIHWLAATAWLAADWQGVPHWLWVGIIGALTDWLEDSIHLAYLRRHAAGTRPNPVQTGVALLSTGVKFAAFAVGLAVSVAAMLVGSWKLFELGTAIEWRGSLAVVVTLGALLVFGAERIARRGAKIWKKRHPQR